MNFVQGVEKGIERTRPYVEFVMTECSGASLLLTLRGAAVANITPPVTIGWHIDGAENSQLATPTLPRDNGECNLSASL